MDLMDEMWELMDETLAKMVKSVIFRTMAVSHINIPSRFLLKVNNKIGILANKYCISLFKYQVFVKHGFTIH